MTVDIECMQQQLLLEIEAVYQQLSRGLDVSPHCVYGIEAKANLFIEQKLLTEQELVEFCQRQVTKHQLFIPEGFWQWVADRQAFCLPAFMQEAPVTR